MSWGGGGREALLGEPGSRDVTPKGCGWNGPGPETGLGMDMDWGRESFCQRGQSGLSQSAGAVNLAGVSCRSYLIEVRGHFGHGQPVWG